MSNYHMDYESWVQLDVINQMGNIGSEVGRAINAWREKDEPRFNGSFARSLDLFDATIKALTSRKSLRSKEVLRAKDQYLSLFFDGKFDEDATKIEKYFMQYAWLARTKRDL